MAWTGILWLLISASIIPAQAQTASGLSATSSNMLQECRALSLEPDDISNCMDNFLDLLDTSMSDIEDLILSELEGALGDNTSQVQAFERSQAAFRDFRRENCLWYLEFSEDRLEAGQIAKNCLAEMSQARLAELQSLVTDGPRDETVDGFYVFGTDRNTFQFCGNSRRYWVEGDSVSIGQLQQSYLTQALTDLAVLYVKVQGAVDDEAGNPYPGHDGVFRVIDLVEMRQPTDSDCQLPAQAPRVAVQLPDAATPSDANTLSVFANAGAAANAAAEIVPRVEPQQDLTAYFGAWLARCNRLGDSYGCVLSVQLEGDAISAAGAPVLKLTRRSEKRTIIDLEFPGEEIEDTDQIRWSIDQFDVGPILQSRIRVDASAARQQIRQRKLIQNDLLPMLMGGTSAVFEVELQSGVVNYVATLIGLTRALSFADEYATANGSL